VFVNKLAYDLKVPFTLQRLGEWDSPARGDIVVFFSPHDGMRLVKRVVALPGDTIELRNNVLLLNGTAMAYESVNAQAYAKETRASLAESLERRTRQAEEKIARAEAQAVDEVRAAAVDTALAAAERILREKASGAAGAALIDDSIRGLKGRLN